MVFFFISKMSSLNVLTLVLTPNSKLKVLYGKVRYRKNDQKSSLDWHHYKMLNVSSCVSYCEQSHTTQSIRRFQTQSKHKQSYKGYYTQVEFSLRDLRDELVRCCNKLFAQSLNRFISTVNYEPSIDWLTDV